MSSAWTLEISQIWAWVTSMVTFSSTSLKSNALVKSSAEAKKICPCTERPAVSALPAARIELGREPLEDRNDRLLD